MKIFVWGNNYPGDNKESQDTFLSQGQKPFLYLKPDSSILKDHKPFFLPDFSEDIRAGIEWVVKIGRLGKSISPRFASRYYSQMTVGVNFVAHDLQQQLARQGLPWDLAVGFDQAAALGEFMASPVEVSENGVKFRLDINGKTVQRGDTSLMRQKAEEGIAWMSRYYTLKIGDLIYTGTPSQAVTVNIGDHLEGYMEGEKLLDFYIR